MDLSIFSIQSMTINCFFIKIEVKYEKNVLFSAGCNEFIHGNLFAFIYFVINITL